VDIELRSEGQRQLLIKTDKRGVAAALARHCSVHPAFVSKWRQGARPETENRLRIEEFLQIPISSFDQEPLGPLPALTGEGDEPAESGAA
jgi:transcriptional regulator with XRE-family HTH domain